MFLYSFRMFGCGDFILPEVWEHVYIFAPIFLRNILYLIGAREQRHYRYLKETSPSVIGVMRMRGTLLPYLQSVDEQANDMFSQLVKQFAEQEGVTEELKRRDQMAWVCAMNNIRDRVNEIVLNEVIFV